eukprot:m.629266 g.629266  ORF g.629266 m.629266 type:complete len:243 (-) comp58272_c0_seq9:11-739(-)
MGDGLLNALSLSVIENSSNPKWKAMEIPVWVFANADHDRPIKFECFDWDAYGSHDRIGSGTTTLRRLYTQETLTIELINESKRGRPDYKSSGTLVFEKCRVQPACSFVDYITCGLELSVIFGVDFTSSNGNPKLPTSLHYMGSKEPNQYVQALTSVGSIIQHYDSDKLFPALGFGAKLKDGVVSHDFALSGDKDSPFCEGITGVREAYERCLNHVELWGQPFICVVLIAPSGGFYDIPDSRF